LYTKPVGRRLGHALSGLACVNCRYYYSVGKQIADAEILNNSYSSYWKTGITGCGKYRNQNRWRKKISKSREKGFSDSIFYDMVRSIPGMGIIPESISKVLLKAGCSDFPNKI